MIQSNLFVLFYPVHRVVLLDLSVLFVVGKSLVNISSIMQKKKKNKRIYVQQFRVLGNDIQFLLYDSNGICRIYRYVKRIYILL